MSDFTRSFLSQRRRRQGDATGPLDELAEHIHALDAAADEAARRIEESARGLRSGEAGVAANEDLLAGLAEALIERAEAIRLDCKRLAGLLDRAREVAPSENAGANGPAPASAPTEPAADASAWAGPAAGEVDTLSGLPEGVRLIATQMAIGGFTRAEIAQRLSEQFGVDEATPVLDEIFGRSAAEAG